MSRTIADRRRLFAGHFVAGIQQAQGVIGALNKGAQADKAEGIVAHDGAVRGAPKQMGTLLDPLTKPAHAVMAEPCWAISRMSSQVALMFSHMSAVIRPRTAWALARAAPRQL